MPALDPYLTAAAGLPAMPEVAQKLIRSFERDDLSLRELADLVGRDNTLAAKVLRTANSARYSPSHNVATLGDAAATLGLVTMRDLALASCLTGSLPVIAGFDRLAFWRGTLAVATYATVTARAIGVDDDSAYVAGLLLRTGRLLMAQVDAARFAAVQAVPPAVDLRFDLERREFGLAHSDVTAALARHWRFPATMVRTLQAASDPMAAHPFDRAAAALRLASVVADARELGVPVTEAVTQAQPELAAHVKLDLPWLESHLPDHALATAGVDSLLH